MDANRKYVQNIIRGLKKFWFSKNIKVVKVLQICQLSIKKLLEWGSENIETEGYLPTYYYEKFFKQRMAL